MKFKFINTKIYPFSFKLKINIALFFSFYLNGLVAQQARDNFEGNSTITSWIADDSQVNVNIPNPFQQGINTSSNVLEYIDYGGLYTNIFFNKEYDAYIKMVFNFDFVV